MGFSKPIDYLNKDSKCEYHKDRNAIYYNWDEKWLCQECLDKELKRLQNEKR